MEFININLKNSLSIERGNERKKLFEEKGLKLKQQIKGSKTLRLYYD